MLFRSLAFPFLKRGVPVHIVHQENIGYPETLKDTRILLMSYSNMKPLESDTHNHLASWVKNGGKIVYAGADSDPFQDIPEWWNEADQDYVAPSEHLFEKLGLSRNPEAGEYDVEKGSIVVFRNDPKEFVETIYGDSLLVQSVKHLYTSSNDTLRLTWKNHFKLERGPFEIISVLDESVSDAS